jgi:hypothetical protein
MSKLQKNASALQREHPALQNMKFLNFFLLLWVIFALLSLVPAHIVPRLIKIFRIRIHFARIRIQSFYLSADTDPNTACASS